MTWATGRAWDSRQGRAGGVRGGRRPDPRTDPEKQIPIAQGVELVASESPDHFTEFFRQQYERYAKLVRDAGIKPE